jgi:rod shape-determining protein MreC
MSERSSFIVFSVLVLGLLLLLASQVRRGAETALAGTFRAATAPVTEGINKAAGGAQGIWQNYVNLRVARVESEALERRLDQLESQRIRAEEALKENARLRELLAMKQLAPFSQAKVAEVIAWLTGGPLQHALLVDRGSSDGIDRGWVATHRGMLVGRVTEVSSGSAKVMTLFDPESGVGVRHQLDRFTGVLRGGNQGPATLTRLMFVPRDTQIAVGDTLITSGLDGVFPPGLLVGSVRELGRSELLTWDATVDPAVDPLEVEELLLIPPPSGAKP